MTSDIADRDAPLATRVVLEATAWVGTPYRHQADRKGIGCDCLGLLRGVWRGIYGFDLERPGPYAPDWAEAGGEEDFLAGVRRNFREKCLDDAQAGDLLLFRWRRHLPVKHAGILVADTCFVHAYQGGGCVTKSALVPQWRQRIAAVFAFPEFPQSSI